MPKVKAVISLDEHLLEEIGNIARELDISCSHLVSLALKDFIQRYQNRQILAQINDIYQVGPDENDIGVMEIIRTKRKKLMNHEE